MRKSTLRVLSSIMCLMLLASFVFEAPLMASVQSIPVRVGDQVLNVTPGQWVSVKTPTGTAHFNVRFVNGQPVALEMSQYTKLVFGDAATAGTTGATTAPSTPSNTGSGNAGTPVGASGPSAGSLADDIAQSTGQTSAPTNQSSAPAGQTSAPANQNSATTGQTSTPANQNSAPAGQTSVPAAGSLADDIAQSTGQTSAPSTSGGGYEQLELPFGDSPAPSTSGGYEQLELPFGDTSATSNAAADNSVTAPKRAWDPSRHPRDPQTGRFISHEEAVQRGLMDPPPGGQIADDVAQSGTAGQVADDAAQSGTAGQVADDAAQSGTAGQIADDVAAGGEIGPDGKPTVGDKFRSGYETGKGMTNQGFQNVKDSLKSGFSAKNLLMTAGITVGVDLATQIMRGEKPSVKKALRTVASAEFAGGVVGAVTGAAAGSFFVPFLSAVPVVGGVMSALAPAFGSIVGSSMGAYLAGDLKNGKFSIREAFKRIDWVGVTGQAIGSTAGAALGSALGPIGTIAGGMIGGYLGNWAAQKIAGMFGRGQANLPSFDSTQSSPSVGLSAGGVRIDGRVENVAAGGEVAPPVSAAADDVLVIGGGDSQVIGNYESEVALAYSKYQELYKLYNEMLRQGRQPDALAVAEAMNQAKKEYDELRSQSNR